MHRIAIGCDPNAKEYKEKMIKDLQAMGYTVTDLGSDDPIYANIAFEVATRVRDGEFDRGILFCGTGLGVSIAANKVPGINAALLTDCYSAERARKSNNAKVACFGAFTMGYQVVKQLAEIFLTSEFDPNSGSAPKVARILEYDQNKA